MVRGTTKTTEQGRPAVLELRANIHNRFDVEVIDAATGEIRETAVAHNIILDSLWNTFKSTPSGATWAAYIHYGSGTAAPNPSDMALTNFIGQASVSEYANKWDPKTGVYQRTVMITLSETTAVGKTLAEVGLASGSDSATLKTKALLKDMNGNQVSLVKTNTDIVKIYATVFVHVNPLGYDGGHIQFFANAEYGMIKALAGKHYKTSSTGKSYTMPDTLYATSSAGLVEGRGRSMPGVYSKVTLSWSFDATTKTFKSSTVRFGASDANGPKGVPMLALGLYNISWTALDIGIWPGGSWYPGSDISGESLGTGNGEKVNFATKFGLISNPRVYVDGVETLDVTFDLGEPVNPKNNFLGQLNTVNSAGVPDLYLPIGQYITTNKVYYENPYHETIGVTKFLQGGSRILSVYGSDDLSSWTSLGNIGTDIPAASQHFRYFRIDHGQAYQDATVKAAYSNSNRTTNVHFNNPPAEGSVITIDYHTDVIAKDSNHVFDFSIEIRLGESTEAQ